MVLEIVKVPRKDPPPDKPINFPPLENLHLELLENKNKLKKGLPPLPVISQKSKPKPLPPPENFKPRVPLGEIYVDEPPEEIVIREKPKPPKTSTKSSTKAPPKRKTSRTSLPPETDDEMIAELGSQSEPVDELRASEQPTEPLNQDELEDEPGEPSEEEPEEEDPYAGMSPEEREAAEKEEYIWRWRILRKQYPSRDIPDWNEHSDLGMMKTSYNRTLKELYLEDNVESYRTYLIGGFIAMEFVCTQFLGIDLGGFTVQQTRMMHKYERLLIELGERPYSKWSSNFPVEIRLLGLIVIQAGIFFLAKIVSSKFGSSVGELFNGITGQPVPQRSQEATPPKRKMKGPKITPDDIRESLSSKRPGKK